MCASVSEMVMWVMGRGGQGLFPTPTLVCLTFYRMDSILHSTLNCWNYCRGLEWVSHMVSVEEISSVGRKEGQENV